MLDILTAEESFPFAVALALMLGIALLEGITTLLGAGLSSLIESAMPDMELDVDVDIDSPDYDGPSALSRLLGWLRIGEVPVLMLLVVFLTGFGLIGLFLQSTFFSVSGTLLPGSIASIPALLLALPVVRLFGGVLARILPGDETDAISENDLIGRVATITLGEARPGSPAEARVTDNHGTTHYVMVEPDMPDDTFPAGKSVLLVSRQQAVFKAIENPNPSLVDQETDGSSH